MVPCQKAARQNEALREGGIAYLIEERRERSRFLGDVAAKNENEGAIGQMETIKDAFVGGVRSADVDEGKFIQHILLRERGRGQEEVEAVNGDLGKRQEEGDEKDSRLLDLDSLELLVVEQAMDAPGFAEKEAKENIERNNLEPGTKKARGGGGNGRKRQATHGDDASKGHGCGEEGGGEV